MKWASDLIWYFSSVSSFRVCNRSDLILSDLIWPDLIWYCTNGRVTAALSELVRYQYLVSSAALSCGSRCREAPDTGKCRQAYPPTEDRTRPALEHTFIPGSVTWQEETGMIFIGRYVGRRKAISSEGTKTGGVQQKESGIMGSTCR